MTSHEELDVATATHNVLSNIGCDALQPASRFISCLWNDMDHNSSEWHVLELNCDDEMLAPFVEELRTTTPNLHLAAGRVRVILTQQRMVSEAFARSVANGIAAGLARWKHGYPYSVTAASMTLPLGGDDKDPLSLSATTWNAILMCNPEVFLSPRAFLGYLLDHMDPHATDLRALERNCDESLLAPFYAAACGTTGIDVATMKAESYLANVCMVDKTASQSAARGIAEGISLWTGTLPSWLDTQREERVNAHESRTSTTDEYQQGRKAITSQVAGLFVTDDHEAFASIARNEGGRISTSVESIGKLPFDKASSVFEAREAKKRLAHMLGKSQNAPIDAFVSSPDPKLTSARRLGNLLRNCGINPTRWVPPTDAMCITCYRDYLPMDDYYLLDAYLGSARVNVALYDCSRDTIECLAMRQGTLESGPEARYSTIVALVTQLDRDSGQRLRHSGGKRFRLRVSVIDEEGQGAIVETGIEAALRDLPLVTECVHLEPSDVARGLAMYIDTVAGPTNDGQSTQRTALLQRMGFSVSLAGTRKGRMELVSANDIIPFDSKTVQLIDNQGIGTPTHILLLRTDGTGIRVPLPKEAKQLCAKWAQIGVKDTVFLPAVDTTVSVDASRHITLELRGPEKNLPQGQTVRIRVDELLGDAEAIAPKERTQHVSSRSSAPITAQSASRITAVGLTIIAILIVVLVVTNTGNQSRTSTASTQPQPAATDNTEADNASTIDKETKEDGEETSPWGPLNDNLPDNFPNPYEGEFGSWKDGIYTSEELGLRIVKTQNVYPAKIHNEASYSKSNGLRFDMGKDEKGSPVYNTGYDCVYVTRLDSTAMGISRVDIPDLPDGMTIEESLDSDEDLERVKFHGKTWWHHTIQEDGQLFETYFIPAGTRVARLAVVTEYSTSGPGHLQTMLDAIKSL